ncbi:MAG: ribosome biogenesis GTP-binding protein YihA/YsxC, partial [Bacillota bacterium]
MKIKSAHLVISAASPKQFVEGDLPEIALVGRSNVGKSSLINALLNRKSLARTSNTPGKTQLLNFYLINESFYLVDLPGYGYAAVSHAKQEGWAGLIDRYLDHRPQLSLVLQLVDLRHPPSALDKQMWEALTHWG